MHVENTKKSQQEINSLSVIAANMSKLSLELFRLTGHAPTTKGLLEIELAKFNKHEIFMQVVEDLTKPGWVADKDNLKAYSEALGRVLSMGRALVNHSPAKYRKLIETYLQVTDTGVVTLPAKSVEKLRKGNTIRVSRKGEKAIAFSNNYAALFNDKPAENGLSLREWTGRMNKLLEGDPGLTWIYNGAVYPDCCKLEGKELSVDEIAATKY